MRLHYVSRPPAYRLNASMRTRLRASERRPDWAERAHSIPHLLGRRRAISPRYTASSSRAWSRLASTQIAAPATLRPLADRAHVWQTSRNLILRTPIKLTGLITEASTFFAVTTDPNDRAPPRPCLWWAVAASQAVPLRRHAVKGQAATRLGWPPRSIK